MAERRMFAKTIIDSDAFLDMPVTARLLYYDLGMRADDDGFVNSPKKIMRTIGSSQDDMNILFAKKFVIPFSDGVVVIKHWKINNYIQSDRYHETKYTEHKEMLTIEPNGAYSLDSSDMYTPCIQDGYNMDTQIRLGKNRLDKNSIDTNIAQNPAEESPIEKMFSSFWESYGNKKGKKAAKKAFSKINPSEELFKSIMDGVEKYHKSRKWRDGYRKEPATWLNGECWNDEYDDERDTSGNGQGTVQSGRMGKEKVGGTQSSPRTVYTLKPRFAGHIYDEEGNDITPPK